MYIVATLDFVMVFLVGAVTFGAGIFSASFFYEQKIEDINEE